MKKILIIFLLIMLTGCSEQFVCTLETEEEAYLTEQVVTFNLKDDIVTDATIDYTMIFEDEDTAKENLNIFETLEMDYELNLDGNKLKIKTTKNYEEYNQTKEELIDSFELDGYVCE